MLKVQTVQYIDTIKFLKDQIAEIRASITFCYPENELEVGRCHGALQAITKTTKAMESFLNSIKEEKESTDV